MSSSKSKTRGTLIVTIVYILAGAAGYASTLLFPDLDLLWRSAIADFTATLVVFICSWITGNASMYDPYWSVIPMWFAAWWLLEFGITDMSLFDWLMVAMVFFWGIRLTMNWWTGWTGMDHQDWRYTHLKEQSGALYPLVNFSGIHLFPTIMVFLGCIPLFMIIKLQGTSTASDVYNAFCVAVTFGAVVIEMMADMQRRSKYNHDGGQVYRSGVWSWSRHPNYFGETMFWVGLFLYVLGMGTSLYWTGAGALAMILLFVFISIPMMEKRQLENKPEYAKYIKEVSSFIPLPPRR